PPLQPAPCQPKPGAALEAPPTKPDAPLDGPKECQPPSELPALRAEKLEFAKPPELRPSLTRAGLPELPNECHWPSLIAGRTFDELFPDEPKLRPASDPPYERPPVP